MEKGYYIEKVVIKEDATPIDNIEKFAWYDEDYETVREFVEYTEEELAEIAKAEAEKVKAQEREELLDSLPETLADADDAICELYETTIAQQAAMDEQDAAICELYELMIGSGE